MLRRVRSETELRVESPRPNRHSTSHRSLHSHVSARAPVAGEDKMCGCDHQEERIKEETTDEDNRPVVALYLDSPTSITSDSTNSLTSPKSAPAASETSNISIKRLQYDVIEKLYLSNARESRPVRLKNLYSARGDSQRESLQQKSQYNADQCKYINGNDKRRSDELRKPKTSTSKTSPLPSGPFGSDDKSHECRRLSKLNPSIPEELGKKVSDWLAGLDEDASRRYARKQMAGLSQTDS